MRAKHSIFFLLILISYSCAKNNGDTIEKNDPDSTSSSTVPEEKIVWNKNTLTRVSSATSDASYSGYARMIQRHDHSLICVYEADGDIVAVTSDDKGATWSDKMIIASKKSGINMATPDILELENHSLLVSYNPRPSEPYKPSKRFAIRTKISKDGGQSWRNERLLYEAGYRPENGCWEPSAVQLPDGEIQLFFSNEEIFPNSDEQNISLLRSEDGGLNWTKKPEVVSFRSGARDGMPVPVVLQDSKEIVVSIEDNGGSNFKPYLVRSRIVNNWSAPVYGSSKDRSSALAHKIDASVYAGAPYLVQLGNGKTLLSYQGTEGRKNNIGSAEMRVVMGNNKAREFKHKTTPFNVPSNKSALWNSLTVLNDDSIIALTSTNAYSNNNHTEVWMIKGSAEEK